MFTTPTLIEPKIFKALMGAGSISNARIEVAAGGPGGSGGLVIVVRAGLNEHTLGAARGGMRVFQSLDGAASVLQSYGIMRFEVNTENWVPKTMVRGLKSAPVEQ